MSVPKRGKEERAIAAAAAAEAELGWLRHLPEVGPVITGRVDKYRERYEVYLRLLDESRAVKHDLQQDIKAAKSAARAQWNEGEIIEARRRTVEGWYATGAAAAPVKKKSEPGTRSVSSLFKF